MKNASKDVIGHIFASLLATGVAISFTLLLAACGDDSSTSGSGITSISNKNISGVSQKGPFVAGSAVKLYELDGNTLSQTGKSFTGKIVSDDGAFSFTKVSLESQYAILEASGSYRNELTGDASEEPITLNAIADLSDRNTVNINLLTHLEYERVLYLMGTGMDIQSAKKQAETEIFNAFGFTGDFVNSEDLNIFSDGDGNAALLAISILFLSFSENSEYGHDLTLTELMFKFASDLEKDGTLDDEITQHLITYYVSSNLDFIRGNIGNWGLGTVPDFEKYLRHAKYRDELGDCSSKNDGELASYANTIGGSFVICKSGMWMAATRSDFLNWTIPGAKCSQDGAIIEGKEWVRRGVEEMDKIKYNFVCDADTFRTLTYIETILNKGCVSYTIGQDYVPAGQKSHYKCDKSGYWVFDVEKNSGTTTDPRDNKTYRTTTVGTKVLSDAASKGVVWAFSVPTGGTQVWMAENMNYEMEGSWCYNDLESNCAQYGRLYNWNAAMKACPEGWHLPSKDEIDALRAVADQMKIQIDGDIIFSEPERDEDLIHPLRVMGFAALPGYRDGSGVYNNELMELVFEVEGDPYGIMLSEPSPECVWSSQEENGDSAKAVMCCQYHGRCVAQDKSFALGVYCVKD